MANVVIVGGGIIGCATAYFLAREGADVTVVERGEVSGEASGLPRACWRRSRTRASGRSCSRSSATRASRSIRRCCQYWPRPASTCATIASACSTWRCVTTKCTRCANATRHDKTKKLQWLEPADLRRVEPQANPKALGGLLVPEQEYVDPQRTTQAIAEAARRAGARIVEHEEVTGFARSKGSIVAVTTANGRYEGDTFVLAGGPWTMALARRLGANIPTRPIRGQMLSLNGPATPLQTMIWGGHAYLIPREDGQTYIGATVEDVGYRKQTTAAGIASLRAGAAELVPSLAKAQQRRAWAGLRPGSPDEMPIMGRLPGWDNAWVSTGHLRNGILLAPISGRLLARAILGEDVPELAALSPSRFAE